MPQQISEQLGAKRRQKIKSACERALRQCGFNAAAKRVEQVNKVVRVQMPNGIVLAFSAVSSKKIKIKSFYAKKPLPAFYTDEEIPAFKGVSRSFASQTILDARSAKELDDCLPHLFNLISD
jgi:hypothetical protein